MRVQKVIIQLIIIFFCFLSLKLYSQQIKNIHFEQSGKMINIYYDLISNQLDDKYIITIFYSEDEGSTWSSALTMVKGDVGANILPGVDKKIVWNVLSEKEKLTGNVKFKIEAVSGPYTDSLATFIDKRDNKIYRWVRIGTQTWMAENLNIGIKINGTNDQNDNGIIEKYCYEDNKSNCSVYGGLYQWDEAMQYVTTEGVRGICPEGWHIPTDSDWDVLVNYLGGNNKAGGKLKEIGIKHWNIPNLGTADLSGFIGLPGGYRNYGFDSFFALGAYGSFWSSSRSDSFNAWYRDLYCQDDYVYRRDGLETFGFSVRCLKD